MYFRFLCGGAYRSQMGRWESIILGSFSSHNFRKAESCRANGVGGGSTRTTEALRPPFCDPDSTFEHLFIVAMFERGLHSDSDDVTPRRPTPEGNLKTTLQLYTLHTDTSALGICKTVSCLAAGLNFSCVAVNCGYNGYRHQNLWLCVLPRWQFNVNVNRHQNI